MLESPTGDEQKAIAENAELPEWAFPIKEAYSRFEATYSALKSDRDRVNNESKSEIADTYKHFFTDLGGGFPPYLLLPSKEEPDASDTLLVGEIPSSEWQEGLRRYFFPRAMRIYTFSSLKLFNRPLWTPEPHHYPDDENFMGLEAIQKEEAEGKLFGGSVVPAEFEGPSIHALDAEDTDFIFSVVLLGSEQSKVDRLKQAIERLKKERETQVDEVDAWHGYEIKKAILDLVKAVTNRYGAAILSSQIEVTRPTEGTGEYFFPHEGKLVVAPIKKERNMLGMVKHTGKYSWNRKPVDGPDMKKAQDAPIREWSRLDDRAYIVLKLQELIPKEILHAIWDQV